MVPKHFDTRGGLSVDPIASDMHSRAEDGSSNHDRSDPNHQRCSRRFSQASDMPKRSLEAVRFLKVFFGIVLWALLVSYWAVLAVSWASLACLGSSRAVRLGLVLGDLMGLSWEVRTSLRLSWILLVPGPGQASFHVADPGPGVRGQATHGFYG
jgi:hypothetical protein